MDKKRLIVGVSGASGAPIAVQVLRALRGSGVESHLILTDGGKRTVQAETGLTPEQFCALADRAYDNRDIGAGPASGTWRSCGMLIVPCSMKTLAGIHSGYSDSLLLRTADVTLKEARPLVLCPRETPLSPIHLRNLCELSQLGVRIVPPMLSYYNAPASVDDLTRHIACKLLDCFGIEADGFRRWEGC